MSISRSLKMVSSLRIPWFVQDANSVLVFDVEAATSSENRILFTLADIDEL